MFDFVHPVGLEPTLYCYNRHLKPARLPIPPRMQEEGTSFLNLSENSEDVPLVKTSVYQMKQEFIILRRQDVSKHQAMYKLHGFATQAERVGVEPTDHLHDLRFSRPVQSAAMRPLHKPTVEFEPTTC